VVSSRVGSGHSRVRLIYPWGPLHVMERTVHILYQMFAQGSAWWFLGFNSLLTNTSLFKVTRWPGQEVQSLVKVGFITGRTQFFPGLWPKVQAAPFCHAPNAPEPAMNSLGILRTPPRRRYVGGGLWAVGRGLWDLYPSKCKSIPCIISHQHGGILSGLG
jgi:hypothetical protein